MVISKKISVHHKNLYIYETILQGIPFINQITSLSVFRHLEQTSKISEKNELDRGIKINRKHSTRAL